MILNSDSKYKHIPAGVISFMAALIGFTAVPAVMSAQEKPKLSTDCVKYLSYYQEDYKAKDFDRAIVSWRKAFELCPGNASQNLYVHGTAMYTKLAGNTKDMVEKSAIVDTILMIQDQRMHYYPGKRASILNNKGGYMINYRGGDNRYLYENLSPIVSDLGPNTSESILVNFMKAASSLQKGGSISSMDLIEAYNLVEVAFDSMSVYGTSKNISEEERKKVEKARGVVESLFSESGVATCDNLLSIYKPKQEHMPENVSIASTILRLFGSVEGCINNDVYMKAAKCVHDNDPSYRSAYALYRLSSYRGETDKAVSYLEQAVSLAGEGTEDEAKALLELCQVAYKEGMRSKAYTTARRLTGMEPSYAGKAWMILGNLWSSCRPEKELDKFAKLWAAADCYSKAKAADESLKGEADSQIASVTRYYPAAADMFMYELSSGSPYTVSVDGMTASTTVRTRN